MELNPKNLGLAGGIVWGACMFVTTLLSMITGYAQDFLKIMGSVYPGYKIGILGSFIGLIYGFLDGFIGFYLFGLVYNRLEKR